MGAEEEILAYLYKYGNTRKSDLIKYSVKKLDHSIERIKKVITRMAIEGKIHYVVHNKLDPPEIYISLEEPLPPETAKALIEAGIQRKASEEAVRNILEEAASIAELDLEER